MTKQDFQAQASKFRLEHEIMGLESTVRAFNRKIKNTKVSLICASAAAFILYIVRLEMGPINVIAFTLVAFLIYLYIAMSLSCLWYNKKLKKAQTELNIISTHE